MSPAAKKLPESLEQEIIEILRVRFAKHKKRHLDIDWQSVENRLKANPAKLWSLNEMEMTGGEPDVIGTDEKTGEIIFCDCSAETPKERRNICYDRQALDSRKAHKPETSAVDLANEIGITLLDEAQYIHLQTLGEFDTKTSSWLLTPVDVRSKGGAIFGDRRFGRVFIYHNGADSYYGARSFRGRLLV